MMKIGYMIWRIGDIVDPYEQIKWLAANGFDAVGIHAAAGMADIWRGIAPEAGSAERRRLRTAWQGFNSREVHAPMHLRASAQTTAAELAQLQKIIEFTGETGAELVTIHATAPTADADIDAFHRILTALDTYAQSTRVRIGIEITTGFDAFLHADWKQIGFTFDLGHMYHKKAGIATPKEAVPPLVKKLGTKIINVHMHDVDDISDHTEPGTGRVDIPGFLQALQAIEYTGPICLELSPDRVTPAGILRAARFTRSLLHTQNLPT